MIYYRAVTPLIFEPKSASFPMAKKMYFPVEKFKLHLHFDLKRLFSKPFFLNYSKIKTSEIEKTMNF